MNVLRGLKKDDGEFQMGDDMEEEDVIFSCRAYVVPFLGSSVERSELAVPVFALFVIGNWRSCLASLLGCFRHACMCSRFTSQVLTLIYSRERRTTMYSGHC